MIWKLSTQAVATIKHFSTIRWVVAVSLIVLAADFIAPKLPKKPLAYYYFFSTAIYARHGELLRLTLASDQQYRLWMPLAEMPHSLLTGTLLYEDRWFWHPGFNPLALLRSAWKSYGHGAHQGGSTITMQVARPVVPHRKPQLQPNCVRLLRQFGWSCVIRKMKSLKPT
jgi:membrane carboxypeptidase/penicillin-binding protein PbpC